MKTSVLLVFRLACISLFIACGTPRGANTTDHLRTVNMPYLISIQEELSSDTFLGRGNGNNKKARSLIVEHFDRIGLKMFGQSYAQPFTFIDEEEQARSGANLVGYLEGSRFKDEYIVVGAHYDHLGIIDGVIYNGADDNASGTSALINLADYFASHPPQHSIIFAAFDAEELGLFGSEEFIENPPIPLTSIVLNINMDMISRNDLNELYVVGTFAFPQFKPILESLGRQSSLKVLFGHDDPNDESKDYWMYSSDNGPFFKHNIPNITFSEEDHPDYHKATDDFENTQPQYFQQAFDLISAAIEAIDASFPK